jgi:hypothetical protein
LLPRAEKIGKFPAVVRGLLDSSRVRGSLAT